MYETPKGEMAEITLNYNKQDLIDQKNWAKWVHHLSPNNFRKSLDPPRCYANIFPGSASLKNRVKHYFNDAVEPRIRALCDKSTAHRSAIWHAGNRAHLAEGKDKYCQPLTININLND